MLVLLVVLFSSTETGLWCFGNAAWPRGACQSRFPPLGKHLYLITIPDLPRPIPERTKGIRVKRRECLSGFSVVVLAFFVIVFLSYIRNRSPKGHPIMKPAAVSRDSISLKKTKPTTVVYFLVYFLV
ncbi:hypothetical protein OIU74_014169 [Salix koriyanagi]|uniref:Uncharacterized protein n=1 Tax=Salix koriyanagi TaxID=2511006 RepID=A0A9Q0SZM6_9ROSI|nr:hypothetical protein OIU74_014169 [Salix koriyanagi]